MNEQSPSQHRSAHLDLDALADALAGERLDAGHLEGCASCTSRLAELAAADRRVSEVLSTLPAPPVPDDLAERLTAALAAEPALPSELPSERATAASVTALPARSPRRRGWLPAAAAAVLLVAGGGLGYALLSGAGAGSDSAGSTAAGGGAGLDLVLNASGTDYADPAAVAGVLPGVLTGSAGTTALSPMSVPDAESRSLEEGSATSSGAAADQARGSADERDAAGAAQAPEPASADDPLARLRTVDGLADCLAALLPPDEPEVQPLALDYAQFQGQPALAVLLPDPEPDTLSVFVVGPGCSQSDDSLLQFLRVDAP